MKRKIVLFIIIIFIMMINLAGCKSSTTKTIQTSQKEESINEQQVEHSPVIEDKKVEKLKYGEITDPTQLEKLWQKYLYDSIATIGNSSDFNCADEIEPIYVAKYCFNKYIAEHGIEDLALANEHGSSLLFPLDTVLEYANRYFNLTNLDLSEVSSNEYDPQKRAFIFRSYYKIPPLHTDSNGFGIHLSKVIKNSDDTVTVVLVDYSSSNTQLVERTNTYTLNEREDGSLYFVNGKQEYINNHIVTLTGEYNHFDKISGFEGNMQDLSMVGEIDSKLILAYTPYDKNEKALLMLVNPDNLCVEKQLELNEGFGYKDIKFTGNKLLILLNDKIVTISASLEQLEDIPLPEVITEKMNRIPNYNKNGFPDIYFGGYDVSNDMTSFVYSDEIGVKLVNTIDKSEKLLSKTVDFEGARLLEHSYHSNPRFIDEDKKIITTMTGYEGTLGNTICDLLNNTTKKYDTDATNIIRYDSGLLMINMSTYDSENQVSDYITLYLDFKTGELINLNLEDTGETGDIIDSSYCFVGQNFASFITYTWDEYDTASSMFYINRLDLKTMTIELQIISIKAARTVILGVLNDGRTVFWYNLNPSENGVCITK